MSGEGDFKPFDSGDHAAVPGTCDVHALAAPSGLEEGRHRACRRAVRSRRHLPARRTPRAGGGSRGEQADPGGEPGNESGALPPVQHCRCRGCANPSAQGRGKLRHDPGLLRGDPRCRCLAACDRRRSHGAPSHPARHRGPMAPWAFFTSMPMPIPSTASWERGSTTPPSFAVPSRKG